MQFWQKAVMHSKNTASADPVRTEEWSRQMEEALASRVPNKSAMDIFEAHIKKCEWADCYYITLSNAAQHLPVPNSNGHVQKELKASNQVYGIANWLAFDLKSRRPSA